MARLSQLIALGVLAAAGVACQSAQGQVLRFYGGPGIVVRAPYVGGIRLGVGPYRPGIVGIGPRPLLTRRAIIGAPARVVDPRDLATPYTPGATRLTLADRPPAPEVTGQQFPSPAQLAELDDGSLLNTLLAIMSQFDADLGRFDTGASWQRYLALPDGALPPPMADGSVTLNWDALAGVHARLERIAQTRIRTKLVSCLEDKPKQWDVPGKYGCKNCRATCDKKKKLCKPVKLDKKK
jgi:hypothetical protein